MLLCIMQCIGQTTNREQKGLEAITNAVPVLFVLVFEKNIPVICPKMAMQSMPAICNNILQHFGFSCNKLFCL